MLIIVAPAITFANVHFLIFLFTFLVGPHSRVNKAPEFVVLSRSFEPQPRRQGLLVIDPQNLQLSLLVCLLSATPTSKVVCKSFLGYSESTHPFYGLAPSPSRLFGKWLKAFIRNGGTSPGPTTVSGKLNTAASSKMCGLEINGLSL